MNCKSKLYATAAMLSVLVGTVSGCTSHGDEPRDLSLKKHAPEAKSEDERLAKMQMVRVYVTRSSTGLPIGWQDVSMNQLPMDAICASLNPYPNSTAGSCSDKAKSAFSAMCVAHYLADAAGLRPEPLRLTSSGDEIVIPQQSASTNVALLRRALGAADDVARYGYDGLVPSTGLCWTHAGWPTGADTSPDLQTHAPQLSAMLAEAYYLRRELTEKLSDAIVAVADQQRDNPSVTLGQQRGLYALQLSRYEAAAQWVGGGPLNSFVVNTGLKYCTSPELTGAARTALSALRTAGVSPADIRDPAVLLANILDNGTANGASVKARLARFWDQPDMATSTKDVATQLGITRDDFEQARAYMSQEIDTFHRSLSAKVQTDSGTGSNNFTRWAATATEPGPMPDAYYAAMAGTLPADRQIPVLNWAHLAYSEFVEATGDFIASLQGATFPAATKTAILDPLSLIYADTARERPARWAYCPGYSVLVDGYASTAGIYILIGDDALRCALGGNIEGATCSLQTSSFTGWTASSTWAVPLSTDYSSTPGVSFNTRAGAPGITGPALGTRLYLAQSPTGKPGSFKVLSGQTLSTTTVGQCLVMPVVPEAERRAAQILAPSTRSCAASRLSCAGTDFDARLPLENELSDDQDGVESSWKHYLSLARQAATEADQLGNAYVEAGLEKIKRGEDNELREKANDVQMSQSLDELQNTCGTSLDPAVLLDFFKNLQAAHTVSTTYTSCTTDANCADPASPSVDNGMRCYGGRCIRDPLATAMSVLPPDEYARLAKCLLPSEILDYVTLGDKPLCVWYNSSNPNDICSYPPGFSREGHPCPAPGLKIDENTVLCTTMQLRGIPSGTQTAPVKNLLGYFVPDKQSDSQPETPQLCEDIRVMRKAAEDYAQSGSFDPTRSSPEFDEVRGSEMFHPARLANIARRIGWTIGFGGYSAITVDGSTKYTTGNAWAGPEKSRWPCNAAARPPSCAAGTGKGLFCSLGCTTCTNGCDNEYDRMKMNEQMRRAVQALRLTALGGDGTGISDLHLSLWQPTVGSRAPRTNFIGTRTRVGSTVPVSVYERPDTPGCLGYRVETSTASERIAWKSTTVGFGSWEDVDKEVKDCGFLGFNIGCRIGIGLHDDTPAVTSWDPNTIWDAEGFYSASDKVAFPECKEGMPNPHTSSNTTWWEDFSSFGRTNAPTSGYFADVLRGRRGMNDVRIKVRDPNSYRAEAVFWDRASWNHDGQQPEIRPFNWEGRELLDGMELLCDVGVGATLNCDTTSPPTVRSVDDLASAQSYLGCLADSINQAAGRVVLPQFPKDVFGALKESSITGTYPTNGGEWGVELSRLQAAMVSLSETEPLLAGEIRGLGYDLENVRIALARSGIAAKVAEIQFLSTVSAQLSQCGQSMVDGATKALPTFGASLLGTAASCANAIAQINFAAELNRLAQQDTELQKELALTDFGSAFSTRATNLDVYMRRIREQVAVVQASLATLEGLRAKARRALSKAIFMRTDLATSTIGVNAAYRSRYNTARIRYERALKNAQRMGFIAKRAIEQRLGVSLADLHESLPLVDAPATWESSVCTTRGIDFDQDVAGGDGGASDSTNFADLFIGDYVTRLENLVESYRLAHSFHEGTDTAVISLRDDVQHAHTECEVPIETNLLYQSGALDRASTTTAPGWDRLRCGMSGTSPIPNCVDVFSTTAPAFTPSDPELEKPQVYQVTFGNGTAACDPATCGWRTDSALAQSIELMQGTHVLSWYADYNLADPAQADNTLAAQVVSVRDSAGVAIASTATGIAGLTPSGLKRYWMKFDLTADQAVTVEIRAPQPASAGVGPAPFYIAALQLERGGVVTPTGPKRYIGTGDTRTRVLKQCEDTEGTEFRLTRWHRSCVRLCPGGFGSSCDGSQSKEYCYRATSFGINQRDIDSGKVFSGSGFARGNFNYRIESIAVNFVGTDIRDCSQSATPQQCYSAGFVPYSLYHTGPFFVRNHLGQDFQASLFDGRIEHARGLGIERYLTNPLGSSDRDLIEPYVRKEYQGRPLNGNFALRVWEEPGINFDGIKDVQVLLNYRYWTKLN